MPITPTYPGVYIEEIPSGVQTITGVATSIAAFFGQAKEGPVDKAVRILSFADFQRTFGDPHPDSELATSVRLFFQNGGTDCYVVRLVKSRTGQKASVVLKNEGGTDVLKFEAKEIGTWGNEIALEVDYNTANPEDTYHLRIYRIGSDGTVKASEEFLNCSADPDSSKFAPNLVSNDSKLVNCMHMFGDISTYKLGATNPGYSESRRPFPANPDGRNALQALIATGSSTTTFKISVDGSPFYKVDLENAFNRDDNENEIKTAIKNRLNEGLPPSLANTVEAKFVQFKPGPGALKVLSFQSTTVDKKSVVIQPGPSKDVTSVLMLGTDRGGIEKSRYSVLRPAPTGIFFDLFNKINDLANHPQDHFRKIILDGTEIDLGTSLVTYNHLSMPDGTSALDVWYVGKENDTTGNFDGVREKLAIMANAINDKSIGWKAVAAGSRLLLKKNSGPNHSTASLSTSTPSDISAYFKSATRFYSLGTGAGTYIGAVVAGIEGEPPDVASYKGKESAHSGFYALDTVNLFNLMIIPKDVNLSEDKYRSLWGPASVYCEEHRAFLIIDPPDSWSESYSKVIDASKGIRNLRIGTVKENSAVFYPRIVTRNNGLLKTIGASGAIAGLMSRTDAERGVWKAPAGVDADIVGISDVDLKLTDPENGVLNKEGVNCLRLFPSGIVSWGARTMAGADDFGSEWKYIPVRRLTLFLEESLFRGTKWVVFEPNDEPLWAKIRLNVGAFMMRLFKQGAFQGSTPDKAFYVKCDSETTPQADIDLGIVNIEVGFAPLKPAEFVIIKIQQMAGEL